MITSNVGVIIPAAGSGERIGGPTPKQYCKIWGKPLFLYTLKQFVQYHWVKKIILVVDNPEYVSGLLQDSDVDKNQVMVVKGACSRFRSIHIGLQTLHKSEPGTKVVIVHDAVRPMLIPTSLVEQLVLLAMQHGAAGLTRPLVSTVLASGPDGFLERSLDRSAHLASETPQAFRLPVLMTAFGKCNAEELDTGTECLHLALVHAGVRARLLPGPQQLWKVTHKKDIYAAMGALKEQNSSVCIVAAEETETVKLLSEVLAVRVRMVVTIPEAARAKDTFSSVIFLHLHDWDQQGAPPVTMLDLQTEGLIIHIVDATTAEDMQKMSVYDVHRRGCSLARHHEGTRKGVVLIHRVTPGEDRRLAELVASLVLGEPDTFSGQTLFI